MYIGCSDRHLACCRSESDERRSAIQHGDGRPAGWIVRTPKRGRSLPSSLPSRSPALSWLGGRWVLTTGCTWRLRRWWARAI